MSHNMAPAETMSGFVIQAQRNLGRRHVDGTAVAALRQRLRNVDKRKLSVDAIRAPAWAAVVIRKVAATPTAGLKQVDT